MAGRILNRRELRKQADEDGTFFLQMVKEPMPKQAPGDAPAPQAK
jgi:hypothetical protein